MLSELSIRNFAIIDDLRLRFAAGFNVLTGETGAGKSIILDAVTLVLGGRADTTAIRSGSDEAYVEAVFRLDLTLQRVLAPVLQAEGLDDESEEYLVLAREVRESGRNIGRVNGRAVSLAVMRQIAEPLIDIHGQGDHLSLLRPQSHLPLLDAFGGLDSERERLAAEVRRLHSLQRELNELRRDKQDLAHRLEMLQFTIEELSLAGLEPDEEQALRAERVRLANAEQLGRHTAEALALLSSEDDDVATVADLLGRAESALSQLARLDESRQPALEEVQGLGFQVAELAAQLQNYLDALEVEPKRLDAIEERLEAIAFLKRKYSADSIAALLDVEERSREQLKGLQNTEVRTAELEAQQDELLRTVGSMAQTLSVQRIAVAGALAAAIEGHLSELRMDGAQFSVGFQTEPDEAGCYVTLDGREQRVAFDQSGIDRVEFLISANPGEPMKPMAKVASGGETARLMLALKTALAEVDETPTLIFDEIDQGIGGRVGDIVGRKLWNLAAQAGHQVVVVTHLPQLAGYGDAHYHVSKDIVDGRTVTAVTVLDRDGRVRELGQMLGTQGDVARDGAESILNQAERTKNAEPQQLALG